MQIVNTRFFPNRFFPVKLMLRYLKANMLIYAKNHDTFLEAKSGYLPTSKYFITARKGI